MPLVPSVDGDAIVADRDRVLTAVNAARPGSLRAGRGVGGAREPGAPRRCSSASRSTRLAVVVARRRLHELRADPLARGTLAILGATALAALVLALVGLLLTSRRTCATRAASSSISRAQGVTAGELRRYLRVRAALVAVAGVVGGIATGAILVALVASVVAVTAGATTPLPPLVVSLDWPLARARLSRRSLVAARLVVTAATARRPA